MDKKLHSKRGASVTFALLVFLVCAIVSSVVLVAGTASSGRMSGLLENEQKYYSVTSAAELLKDMIEDRKVVVERTQVTTQEKSYDASASTKTTAGDEIPYSDSTRIWVEEDSGKTDYGSIQTTFTYGEGNVTPTPVTTILQGSPDERNPESSFITDAALKMEETSVVSEEYEDKYPSAALSSDTVSSDYLRSMALELSEENLLVLLREKMGEDYSLVFTLVDGEKTESEDGNSYEAASLPYYVTLSFECDRNEVSTGVSSEDGPKRNVTRTDDMVSYQYTTTTTKVTTTEYTWNLVEICAENRVPTPTPSVSAG